MTKGPNWANVREVDKMLNWLRRLLFQEEEFESHINTMALKWDRIPNPTKETREIAKIPVHAHRTTARNLIGALLLKRRWKQGGFSGPAGLTEKGRVLEVYPLPKDLSV